MPGGAVQGWNEVNPYVGGLATTLTALGPFERPPPKPRRICGEARRERERGGRSDERRA